jgi:hypothetical protein
MFKSVTPLAPCKSNAQGKACSKAMVLCRSHADTNGMENLFDVLSQKGWRLEKDKNWYQFLSPSGKVSFYACLSKDKWLWGAT